MPASRSPPLCVSPSWAHLRVCRDDWVLFNRLDQETTCWTSQGRCITCSKWVLGFDSVHKCTYTDVQYDIQACTCVYKQTCRLFPSVFSTFTQTDFFLVCISSVDVYWCCIWGLARAWMSLLVRSAVASQRSGHAGSEHVIGFDRNSARHKPHRKRKRRLDSENTDYTQEKEQEIWK